MNQGDGSHRFNPEGQIAHGSLYADELPSHARDDALLKMPRHCDADAIANARRIG